MDIIILGAGQVGGTLAENLAREENDITVVDSDRGRLRELQTRLDIRTVTGIASHPNVLKDAGADNADMLIAVTNSDEANLVACQIADKVFHTPTKIARIRSPRYAQFGDVLFAEGGFPIDVFISPEQLVTDYVTHLIEYPGALQVLDFAEGRVRLVAIRPYFGGPLVGKSLSMLKEHLPHIEARIAAIYRGNRSIPLTPATVVEIGDEVFFLAESKHIREVMGALRRLDTSYKRIMIAGGGNIGCRLAESLENDYQVKIIDHNPDTTERLASQLNKSTVLLGDASDRELLLNENIEYTDVFCAVTNDDEVNIMSCMQAKRMGVRQVMALITRTAYVDLIEGSDIDIAISPQQATIGSILTHIRRGDIVNVHSLRRGAAEAIEIIAHGDKKSSSVIGRTMAEIKLPKGTNIGAIVRGEEVFVPHHETVIEPEDHVILFLADKKYIEDVERLFQVSATFF
ncbi:MAG: Trk system potassium transporter TrkA [Legionellales bacterium]|nr:Trk system potassium transporter TrkA [Legionellales bacterium]|tara:strand:+ start:4824 stop:6200 length:1377 start_codon:yes stop_codon:yes gene_type:complete